ncbi:MAG TPA: TIGR03545 family protein [Thermodesulfobacteriota bacterium]
MRWIRWRGLLAFLAITAVLLVFWFLFIDSFIERRIEKAGTSIVGAKVELDGADLTLFPLGLTLTGLQVTNPDAPMRNIFEAGRISFLMDGVHLIRKKYIIEDMAIEGVRLNTQRSHSGAIGRPGDRKEAPEEQAIKLLTFELPDIKEVLNDEDLQSIKIVEATKKQIEADRQRFEKELKALPDKKKIEDYERRIEKIKGSRGIGGVLGGTAELLAIKKEIEADLDRISAMKDDLSSLAADYGQRVKAASAAPRNDVRKILEKYSLSAEGIANLGSLFIGGRLRELVEDGLRWREKLDLIVAPEGRENGVEVQKTLRGRGVDVQFREYAPLPDFLIRRAAISASIPTGDFSGLVTNITGDQDILGSPMRIRISGERLRGLSSALLEGEINRVAPGSPRDLVNFAVRQYRLHDFTLSENKYVPILIGEALADFNVTAELKGSALRADIGSSIKSAAIDAVSKEQTNEILSTIAAALSNVKAFSFNASAAGTIDHFRINVSSDLDRVLNAAAGGVLRERMLAFESALSAEVYRKTEGPLKELNRDFEGLMDVNAAVKERFDGLNMVLAEAARGALPKLPF